jgi:hypothetical protein
VAANIFFVAGRFGIFSSFSAWTVIRGLSLIPLGIYSTTLYRAVKKQRVV